MLLPEGVPAGTTDRALGPMVCLLDSDDPAGQIKQACALATEKLAVQNGVLTTTATAAAVDELLGVHPWIAAKKKLPRVVDELVELCELAPDGELGEILRDVIDIQARIEAKQ